MADNSESKIRGALAKGAVAAVVVGTAVTAAAETMPAPVPSEPATSNAQKHEKDSLFKIKVKPLNEGCQTCTRQSCIR